MTRPGEHQLTTQSLYLQYNNVVVVYLGVYYTHTHTLPLSPEEPIPRQFRGGLVSVSPSRVALGNDALFSSRLHWGRVTGKRVVREREVSLLRP